MGERTIAYHLARQAYKPNHESSNKQSTERRQGLTHTRIFNNLVKGVTIGIVWNPAKKEWGVSVECRPCDVDILEV